MSVPIFVLLLATLLGWRWVCLPPRHLPVHRVRHLHWRLWLRLHPGKGHASLFELWYRWGRLATFRRSGRVRRSLSRRQRLFQPESHSVAIGRAQFGHALRVPLEEHVLVMAPPRTGKTGLLGTFGLHYPGAVLSTTTKADIFEYTSPVRSQVGPIHVFNPQGIGAVPSTFRWNPLEGCEDQAVAIRRADAFAKAVSMGGVEDSSFWTSKASDYLRAFFHAAALAHVDMRAVTRWVLGGEPDRPVEVLRDAGAHQWGLTIAELGGEAQKTAQTIRMTMSRCLAFMTDPVLASSVLPGLGSGFDIEAFLREKGTLYLIAEADQDDSPVAPLFACMAGEIHHTAALLGQAMPGGRLDPPLLMALDEIVQTCPVPVPTWLADAGGKGIQIVVVAHGEAQLASRWKDHGKQVILDTCGVKVLLPGISDPRTLETASRLCGQAAYLERGQDHHSRHDVMTPDMIRQLPVGFALVIRGGLTPVVAKLPAVWRDRAYRRAARRGLAAGLPRPIAEALAPDLGLGQPSVVPDDELPPDPFPPGTAFPWDS